MQKLEQQGYEVKRGKHTAVKGKGQKRFIRFRTLGTGYGEDEIKAVLEGKVEHKPYQRKPLQEQPFQLLVDIQAENGSGQKCRLQKVGNQVQSERDVQDVAVLTRAENQQCRGTTGTCSGGNRTLSCLWEIPSRQRKQG